MHLTPDATEHVQGAAKVREGAQVCSPRRGPLRPGHHALSLLCQLAGHNSTHDQVHCYCYRAPLRRLCQRVLDAGSFYIYYNIQLFLSLFVLYAFIYTLRIIL